MGIFLVPDDLTPFATIDEAKAEMMIDDAESLAMLSAPCLAPDFDPILSAAKSAAVKAVLRGAIVRWADSGSGAITQQQAGPFGQSIDTRQTRRNMFWPTEITQLQSICSDGSSSSAFTVETAPSLGGPHLPWCSLMMGAAYCSCGVDIAGHPIYEL